MRYTIYAMHPVNFTRTRGSTSLLSNLITMSKRSPQGKKRRAASSGTSSGKASSPKRKKKGSIIDGWWELDLERSDTMEKYLGAMNLNETAIQAALKGEKDVSTKHRFLVTSDAVTIERRSRMGNNVTKLVYGVPNVKTMSTGEKKMIASYENKKVSVTIDMPLIDGLVKIVDTREVDSEDVLVQNLVTSQIGNPAKSSETKRYYKRCDDPGPLPTNPKKASKK